MRPLPSECCLQRPSGRRRLPLIATVTATAIARTVTVAHLAAALRTGCLTAPQPEARPAAPRPKKPPIWPARQHLSVSIFKSDMMGGVDYKRFVRLFYDPQPKYDESGTSIWFLGQEYAATPPKAVSTTDHEDVVEIESSSVDSSSHCPSDTATSVLEDSLHPAKPRPSSFDDGQPISGDNVPSVSNDPADGGWPLPFLEDFESRAWMTYRSNFPPIPRSQEPSAGLTLSVRLRNFGERDGFSSDTGWGCMVRSGQSLLANALIMLHLGRQWRRPSPLPPPSLPPDHGESQSPASSTTPSEAGIIALFADSPLAPFSIHNFVSHGATSCNVHPGQWFGPSATASCIAGLASANLSLPMCNLRVSPDSANSTVQPTLILLAVRLGIDRITPVYHEALKSTLTFPQSVGIAGGRPSSSHYFVGHQDSLFLYLDPHETRPALAHYSNPSDYTREELDSFHTRRLRGLRIQEMDPSMLIGFLIRDEDDWQDWKQRVKNVKGKGIVHVYDKEPPHTSGLRAGEGKEREGAVDEIMLHPLAMVMSILYKRNLSNHHFVKLRENRSSIVTERAECALIIPNPCP
ncbi:hypothetical protein DV737_g3299, partial [Chaetothyriales sp. CBS 132003]